MFYPIREREDCLFRIAKTESQSEKEVALRRFIDEERELLAKLSPPVHSSGPLRTAESMLATVLFEKDELLRRMTALGLSGAASDALDGFHLG